MAIGLFVYLLVYCMRRKQGESRQVRGQRREVRLIVADVVPDRFVICRVRGRVCVANERLVDQSARA